MSLRFSVTDMHREIATLRELARPFLDLASDQVLAGADEALNQICLRRGERPSNWEIKEKWPLRTLASEGEFQPQRRSGHVVHGTVSFIWQLLPVIAGGGKRPVREVALVGKASTKITLVAGSSDEPGDELAMWRMEVADDASPGSYFHVQVLGRRDDLVFPHHVDIPRLPSTLVSPFACIEFLLAELFQDRWQAHANRDVATVRDWHGLQSKRLRQQLQWHMTEIDQASGSPWCAWKRAVPPSNLFTS